MDQTFKDNRNKYQEALNRLLQPHYIDDVIKYSEIEEKKDYDTLCELIDKVTPMKPTFEGDGYSDGELVYDVWICPKCDKDYEVEYEEYKHCPNCGQAIDWSE